MNITFAGYEKLRRSGKGECLFNDCLADAGQKGAIERSCFAEKLLREGLKFAGQTVFKRLGDVICSDTSSYEEYENLEGFRPIPGGSQVWQNYHEACLELAKRMPLNCHRAEGGKKFR